MSSSVQVNGEVPQEVVSQLNDLFEQGLYVQAYEASKIYGPLQSWRGAAARVLASRLAHHLGSPALSARIIARAAKEHPSDAQVQYYYAFTILEWRGPQPAWKFLRGLGDMPDAKPEEQADLYAIRAQIAASLRDFQTAETWLIKAQELYPGDPWLALQKAYLFEYQDRYVESLEAAVEACKLHPYPYYRPGIIAQAHVLQLLNRDQEALELLRRASGQLESAAVEMLLYALQVELRQPEEALQTLTRYERLTPMREKGADEWLRAQRCWLLHLCGNRDGALELARTIDDKFHRAITAKLSDPDHQQRRVQLPVGFVRQNYKTCAPATLAALGRYWKATTDHLQLVAEICYDGTPAQKQREWAEQNGWYVREFKLTWDSAVALLDAGIPFAVTTVQTANAHLQAIVGYDTTRGTFLLRDPYNPYLREAEAAQFLEYYASSGPRCFVMVPAAGREKLQAIPLPEMELYDLTYQVELALAKYDRPKAVEAIAHLKSLAADHRLTWAASRSLAIHDGDNRQHERCIDSLLQLFPKDGNLLLSKLAFLRDGPYQTHRDYLAALCKETKCDPIFFQQLAGDLLSDARQEVEAERLIMKSLAGRPYDAANLQTLADLRWQQRKTEEAYEYYRFAASLEDKREEPTRALFAASRHLRKHHEVIGYMRDRFNRFGRYSHLTLVTLFWAEVELSETALAFKHLAQAIEWRPDDAVLRCFAADVFARFGNFSEAGKHLQLARGKTTQLVWQRTAAQVAMMQGERAEALRLWQEVRGIDPMAYDACESILQVTAETGGPKAVRQQLDELRDQFPYHLALQQLVVSWLQRDDLPEAIQALEKMEVLHPANGWVRRELADLLAQANQLERALEKAQAGLELEPNVPASYCIRGFVYLKQGRQAEADEDFRQALRLSVDNEYALHSLLEGCATHDEKKQALEFIQQELLRQVTFGGGLLVFRELAYPVLEQADLAGFLRQAHRERPDLWQSWSALIHQLGSAGELHEAWKLANEATQKFSLSPRIWLDAAFVRRLEKNTAGEIECLETAVRLSSAWVTAVGELAEAYERVGEFWKARRIVEAALIQRPLDVGLHEWLAHYLWLTGDREEGLSRLLKIIDMQPGSRWAWERLAVWGKECGQPQLAAQKMRQLTVDRPGEARSWLLLAEQLKRKETLAERQSAVEKALQLQPLSVWGHLIRVDLLWEEERLDEALKACEPAVFEGKMPRDLLLKAVKLEWAKGNGKQAMIRLENLLEKHPDYIEAWRLQANWLWENGEYKKAAQAADKIARLNPLDEVAWGYKGAWEWGEGNTAAAITCFFKAFELSPRYVYAGFSLFDLLLEAGRLDEAAEILHTLRKHRPGPGLWYRDLRLAVARKELHRAPDLFVKLARDAEAEQAQIKEAWTALTQAGLVQRSAVVLQDCVLDGKSGPAAAAFWMQLKLSKQDWNSLYLIRSKGLKREVMEAVLKVWLDAFYEALKPVMTDALQRLRFNHLLKKCLAQFEPELRAKNDLWASVIVMLINLQRHRAAISWVTDWRQREGLEAWMLCNVSLILEKTGDDHQAAEVYLTGAKLSGHGPELARLLCRAALEMGLSGKVAESGQLIARVHAGELSSFYELYWRLANLVFRAVSMPGHVLSQSEKFTLLELAKRSKQRPADKRLLRRIVTALQKEQGGNRRLGLWLWWQLYGEVVWIASAVALILLFLIKSMP